MPLHQEITELFKAILAFENDITPLKEQLFNMQGVTRQLIWNHMIGQTYPRASGEQIETFFQKHGLHLSKMDVELTIWQYSSNKDSHLRINDLWHIFKPLSVNFIDQINAGREKKAVLAHFHAVSYKISDMLVAVMARTINFIRKCHQMKKNIVAANPDPFIIEPCDPAHLQIYLNKQRPEMILKEVEIVFKHLLRNQSCCPKNLQEYFIPLGYKGKLLNPNFVREQQVAQEMEGIQLIKQHAQNVYHITQQPNKKVLYLHNKSKGTSLSGSSKLNFMNTKTSLRSMQGS